MNLRRIAALLRELANELERDSATKPAKPAAPKRAAPKRAAAKQPAKQPAPKRAASRQAPQKQAPQKQVIPLTHAFVSVDDVARALGVTQETAYQHLRRSAGQAPGTRGLLRVPVKMWEAYVARWFAADRPRAAAGGRRAPSPRVAPPPVARARPKV